jgi:hypothetical protein
MLGYDYLTFLPCMVIIRCDQDIEHLVNLSNNRQMMLYVYNNARSRTICKV